jgi:ribosome-associated protein
VSVTKKGALRVSSIAESVTSPQSNAERSLQLAIAAAQSADENRGTDIVVLDMRESTPVFDYFVIATGTSRKQLHAMSEEIDHKLEDDLGDKRMGIEGYRESLWILLDYGSVVIHLFTEETREYYDLEHLWSQAKRVEVPALSGNPAARPK